MKYSELAALYEKLESTTKRLEKTYYVSELLKKTEDDDLGMLMLLLNGRVFPIWDESKIGIAARSVIKAIATASHTSAAVVEKEWKKVGDLGEVAEKLIVKKKGNSLSDFGVASKSSLTLKKVFDTLRMLPSIEGEGSVENKQKKIVELLSSASSLEAKYIVRLALEQMRVGIGEGSVRDAIAWAYFPKVLGVFYVCSCGQIMPNSAKCLSCGKKTDMKAKPNLENFAVLRVKKLSDIKEVQKFDLIEAEDEKVAREAYDFLIERVQHAIDVTADFAKVALAARKDGLKGLQEMGLEAGSPIKVMLYQKSQGIEDAFNTVGKPAALEYKYDGFRMQLHKKDGKIILFTRRLEDVTSQFPDVVETVSKNINAREFILDCEVIGIDPKTKRWMPFQDISQRIKRKYDIHETVKKIPVMVNVFDAVEVNGKSMLETPFDERRKMIEKIVEPVKEKLALAKQIITSSEKDAEKFYAEALAMGNEGIMIKNLKAPYKPGSRVGFGVKVKPIMETLDLVIVGAEWGTGKRASWLSSFVIACRSKDEFLPIGKVGTGFKEKEEEDGLSFDELTKMLKPLIVKEKGREVEVKPSVVIEVSYEEIQQSPTYGSGYALRFPRLVRLRDDRRPEECSSLYEVEKLFATQRARG